MTPAPEVQHKAIPPIIDRAVPRDSDTPRTALDTPTTAPQTRPVSRVADLIHSQRSPPHDVTVAPSSSVRREFIVKFVAPSLEAIWRSNKHGYNRAHDAPFERFQAFFMETKPHTLFTPENILPGDLVSFLQQMHEGGASFASLKDASAFISMAFREATDGDIALGDKESVKRFLKSVRIHEPAGPRKR
jgi:hypothetical protein